jgi:hypothetical protein
MKSKQGLTIFCRSLILIKTTAAVAGMDKNFTKGMDD